MNKCLIVVGLILEVLGVVPAIIPAVLTKRQESSAAMEDSMRQTENYGLSGKDKLYILAGFGFIALGAIFQILGVLLGL